MNNKSNSFDNTIKNLYSENDGIPKIYNLIMVVLSMFILIICPTLIGFGYALIGVLLLAIGISLFFILISYTKGIRRKKFYKIKDAYKNFNIINTEDEKIINDLYNDSALTFIAEPTNDLLDFIYNWLNNEEVIKSQSINLYVFNGETLKKTFNSSRFDSNIKFISIFLKDLNLNKENLQNFSRSHFTVGSRWFDDIVNNDK